MQNGLPATMAAPGNKVDAVIGWEPGMTHIMRAGHGKMIVEAQQFEEEAQITCPFLISTTKTFRDEHPDIVQKALNDKYIREHKDEAVRIFAEDATAHGRGHRQGHAVRHGPLRRLGIHRRRHEGPAGDSRLYNEDRQLKSPPRSTASSIRASARILNCRCMIFS